MDNASPMLILENNDALGKDECPPKSSYHPTPTKIQKIAKKQVDKPRKRHTREVTPVSKGSSSSLSNKTIASDHSLILNEGIPSKITMMNVELHEISKLVKLQMRNVLTT